MVNASGVRSSNPGRFVHEDTVKEKLKVPLQDLVGILKTAHIAAIRDDAFGWCRGIIVPCGTLPANIPSRPVEVFTESYIKVEETKLAHQSSIREGHSIAAGEF